MAEGRGKTFTLSQVGQMWLRGTDGGDAPLGGPSDPYRQALWVYRAIVAITRPARSVPMRLSVGTAAGTRDFMGHKLVRVGQIRKRKIQRGEKAVAAAEEGEIVEGGPLFDLLQRPNPEQTWGDFIEETLGCLMLAGRVHWLFDDMIGPRPVTMYVVSGKQSKPVPATTGRIRPIVGWKFRGPDGQEYPVVLDECITFQFRHPLRPRDIVAPVEPANLAIISDFNASKFNAAMFGNSAEPGGVLKTAASFNAQLDAQIRTSWAERHRGAARAKSPAVLWGGLDWQSVASTMQDMQFDAGKRLTRTEQVAAFGVPEVTAGFFSDANYGFAEQGREQFWTDTEIPLLGLIAEGIDVHLCPRYEGNLEAWADVEQVPIVRKMRLASVDTATKLFACGRPWSDINDLLDLGLPDRDWDETGFLAAGLLPAQDVAAGGGFGNVPEGPPPGGSDEIGQEPQRAIGAPASTPGGTKKEWVDKASRERIWQAWARAWAPLARQFRQVLRSHLLAQERKLVAGLRREAGTESQGAKGDKAPNIDRLLLEIFADPKARQAFRVRIRSALADGQELGLRQALAEAGLSGDALKESLRRLLVNPAITEALNRETVRISTLIDSRTRNILRANLREGLEAGEDARKLADRVQGVMGNRRGEAMGIARNAVGQTLSQARHEGHLAAGMTHKMWIYSRGPGERRPAHIEAEARYAADPCPISEPFEIDGVYLMYPRDFSSGHPEETVNCQCLQIAKRIAPSQRGERGTDELEERPFVTYREMLLARTPDAPMPEHGEKDEGHDA